MFNRTISMGLWFMVLAGQNTWAANTVHITTSQFASTGLRVEAIASVPMNAQSTGFFRLNGLVVLPPQAQEVVSVPFAGFIQTVLVSPTDVLRAGQLVAQVYSTQMMETQRDYIQADIHERQSLDRLQRSERLFKEGIVAESRVREDRYVHAQAKVVAQERRQTLNLQGISEAKLQRLSTQTELQAQVGVSTAKAGTVIEVLVSPGQRVEAGAPLLKLARQGMLALELQATPAQSQQIKTGAKVTVAGCQQPGQVKGLSSMVRGGNQAVTVHVDMVGNCLRPNQAVEAELQSSSVYQAAFSVPIAAVFQHGGKDLVFVKVSQGFVATPVQVLSREGDKVLLAKGLVAGSEVLTQGMAMIKGLWLGMGEQSPAATGVKP